MFPSNPRPKSRAPALVAAAGAALLLAGQHASAVPILGPYIEDARGDAIPSQTLTHELGDAAIFPPNEAIFHQSVLTNVVTSVPNDGNPNDWLVRITNVSGIAWQNLFFVVDVGGTVGNADGTIEDAIGAPGIFTDAFRIDGTVTGGVNNNLILESMTADEIFAPGEVWEFLVTNFNAGAGWVPPMFMTPGQFAGSSPYLAGTVGNASIVATPVPEPSAIALAGLGVGSLAARRRRPAV